MESDSFKEIVGSSEEDDVVVLWLHGNTVDDENVLVLHVCIVEDVGKYNWDPDVIVNERSPEVCCKRLYCDLVVTGIIWKVGET